MKLSRSEQKNLNAKNAKCAPRLADAGGFCVLMGTNHAAGVNGSARHQGWFAGAVPAAEWNNLFGSSRICTAAVTLPEAFG